MENLEKFIAEHRSEFDDAAPHARVWASIERSLPQQSTVPMKVIKSFAWRTPLRAAAAVLLLISVGAAAGIFWVKKQQSNTAADLVLQNTAPEYNDMEQYYQSEVKQSFAKLANYKYQDTTLETDFRQMEAVASDLKQELASAPKSSREDIVKNLVENYQARLHILKRILSKLEEVKHQDSSSQILNQIKNNKNEKDEKLEL